MTTGLSVLVVDGRGDPVREGSLRLSPSLELFGKGHEREMRELLRLLRPQDLSIANPFVAKDLPDSFSGLSLGVLASAPGLPPSERKVVVLEKGRVVEVRIEVLAPRTLEIRVEDSKSGEPVPGARVLSITEAERRDLDLAGIREERGPGWSSTDAEGHALLTDLGPGLHDLSVAAAGYRPLAPEGVEPGPGLRTFRVERLEAAGTLVARLRDPSGGAVRGVRVEVRVLEGDRKLLAETDADGTATFVDLPPGHVLVRVDFLQWLELARERKWPEANVSELTEPVEIPPGGREEVLLGFRGGSASVVCEVVDRSGAPVPGVGVTLSGGKFLQGRTDAKGTVVFEGLPAGDFRFSLRGRADWMDSEERSLEEGDRRTVRLALGHRMVRGRVLVPGSDGRGLAGATVTLSGARYGQSVADGEGRFTLEEALPGSFEVCATADGFATFRGHLEVPAEADPSPLEIAMIRGGRVRIRAGASVAALPEGAVRLLDPMGEEVELRRDETGTFWRQTWEQVPGSYSIEIAEKDGSVRRTMVEVKDGTDAVVDLGD